MHVNFSIHWNSFLILSYAYYFTHIFALFTYFSNPHTPALVTGILVETWSPTPGASTCYVSHAFK